MSINEAVALKSTLSVFSELIQLMEGARAYAEESLDSLPGIFAMVDPQGRIFKGNRTLSQILKLDDPDLILGRGIHELFAPDVAKDFIARLQPSANGPRVIELELPVRTDAGIRIFHWGITTHLTKNAYGIPLVDIIGTDVTALRNTQARITEIFGTLPIGIIAVDLEGKFQDNYTAHTTRLLGRELQPGEEIEAALFPEASNSYSLDERKRIKSLLHLKSSDQIVFEAAREACPNTARIHLNRNGIQTEVHLGYSYQAVMHGTQVQKVLIVIEDRTSLVQAQESAQKDKTIENSGMRRIFELKRVDPLLLPIFMEEIQGLFDRLETPLAPQERKGTLHTIKGNARGARFERLTSLAHQLETTALSGTPAQWEKGLAELQEEWRELQSLAGALSSNPSKSDSRPNDRLHEKGLRARLIQNRIRELSLKSLTGKAEKKRTLQLLQLRTQLIGVSLSDPSQTLEPWLQTMVQTTAEELGKEVKLGTDWSNVLLTDNQRTLLSEILLHLTTNAIDHGIESPAIRRKSRKKSQGLISVQLREAPGQLLLSVEDDGCGLSFEKIQKQAAAKGLLPSEWEKFHEREQKKFLTELLFAEGFSTQSVTTRTSGRGVGLSTVQSLVQQNGGTIQILSPQNGKKTGAVFQVGIPAAPALENRRNAETLASLFRGSDEVLATLGTPLKLQLLQGLKDKAAQKAPLKLPMDTELWAIALTELLPPPSGKKIKPVRSQLKIDKKHQVLSLTLSGTPFQSSGIGLHLMRQFGVETVLKRNQLELRIPLNPTLDAAPRKSLKTEQR